MADEQQDRVQQRRVFYIPGYDPFHPRRYRELYRKEAKAQAEISGYEIGIKPRKGARYGWTVDAVTGVEAVQAEIEVLVWSDLVRDSMATGIPGTYLQLCRTAWIYIASGTLRRLMWLRKGPVIAALYPVGMLLMQLALAIMAGWVLGGAATALTGIDGLGWLAGLPLMAAVLLWFRKKDNKLFAYYLMHDYAYSAKLRGAYPPELETRMAAFASDIAQSLTEEVDEVLVVGHSSGAFLAVTILADLLRQKRLPANGPRLSLLTLGQVIPMVSFLPEANRLRGDLHFLSQQGDVTWVDVSAPGDGCAFALCDPVAVSGVAPENQKGPLILSAAFTKTLLPDTWANLRWRFFRLHFQYLCAFDNPGDYDYFQITAGPMTLRDRFLGRKPSRSRIDRPASRYTSIAA